MLANKEKMQLGGLDNEAGSGLSRMGQSSHFRLSLAQLILPNPTPIPILLRAYHLQVIGSVSHPRPVQRTTCTTRNVIFRDGLLCF